MNAHCRKKILYPFINRSNAPNELFSKIDVSVTTSLASVVLTRTLVIKIAIFSRHPQECNIIAVLHVRYLKKARHFRALVADATLDFYIFFCVLRRVNVQL